MSTQQIGFQVDQEEFEAIQELRGEKSWRELFLGALGIPTKRRVGGPKRRSE